MIKVLRSDLNCVAFDTESLHLYPLPPGTADSLSSQEECLPQNPQELPGPGRLGDNGPGVSRLVLLIAQACGSGPRGNSRSPRRCFEWLCRCEAVSRLRRRSRLNPDSASSRFDQGH